VAQCSSDDGTTSARDDRGGGDPATCRSAPHLARSSWPAESATLGPALLRLTVLLLVAAARGATHFELLTASLTVLVTQLLPGVVIWRAMRPVHGWWIEDIALGGLALGAGLAVLAQVAAVATSVSMLGWLPLALAGGVLALPVLSVRILGVTCLPPPRLWGIASAASLAPASRRRLRRSISCSRCP